MKALLQTQLRWPYFALTAAYCAGIFALSASSDPPGAKIVAIPGLDKIAHAVLYGGLAAVVAWGIRRSNDPVNFHVLFYAPIVFAALYGVTDEVHQLSVPERSFSALDWFADTTGAFVALTILFRWLWKIERRPSIAAE